MSNLYENFRTACKKRGTNITNVLAAIGKPSSSTGSWKKGQYPHLDTVLAMAKHLDMSLDELVYGEDAIDNRLKKYEQYTDWMEIIDRIPEDRQEMCKDFLRTHMAVPEKFLDKKNA